MTLTKVQTRRLIELCEELESSATNLAIALFDAKGEASLECTDQTAEFRRRVVTAHDCAELLCARIASMANVARALDANAESA